MLRLAFKHQVAIGVLALCLSMPAFADEPKGPPATAPTPPPTPTASDQAPGGNEDNHPLVGFGAEAFIRHSAALDCGNQAAADAELAKLRYAIDELRKRAKAAKKAGQFSAVKVDDVQRQINLLESFLRAAEQRRPRNACSPPTEQAQTRPQPPASPQQPVKQTSMALPPWANDILAAHNAARAAVGAPPLQWNPELQAHATARAGELAQVRQLVHAPREGRGTERENILSAPIGYSPGRMIDLWSKESRHFRPGLFPDVSDTGNWADVAHYTQMIWPQTTEIGCGYAPGGGFNWLVCRYNPGGNKDGKPVIAEKPQYATALEYHETGTRPEERYTPPDDLLTEYAKPAEAPPPPAAANSTIRARPVGGDYGRASADPVPQPKRPGAWYVGGDFGAMILEDVAFDYGLQPTISSSRPATPSALSFMINGMLDFGDDDGVSGFVGAGIGAARVDYNNVRAFSNQGAVIDNSDTEFARQMIIKISCSPGDTYCQTNVLAPDLLWIAPPPPPPPPPLEVM